MKISTPYLENILNESQEEVTETYASLKHDDEGINLDICYCGITNKITDKDFYIGSGEVELTPEQLTLVEYKLKTLYNNFEDVINESKKDYLDDLRFEQMRDNSNGL